MTRSEVIKELLKSNLDEFNNKLDTELLIRFENDDFIISYRNTEILRGPILDYNIDPFSQVDFILYIGNKLFSFFKDIYGTNKNDYIENNPSKGIKLVIGGNDVLLKKYGVKVDKEKLRSIGKISNDEDYGNFINNVISKIKNNLDDNRICIFNEELEDGNYFHVYINIYERILAFNFVDEHEFRGKGKYINNVESLMKRYNMYVFYSEADETEAEQAVEYIKGLIYG